MIGFERVSDANLPESDRSHDEPRPASGVTSALMPSTSQRLLIERLKSRKGRPREGLVLAEGLRCVQEVLSAGASVRFAVRSPRLLGTEAGRTLAADILELGVPTDEVADRVLDRMAATAHPQGLLVVCEEPELSRLPDAEEGRILILDRIQDPGNLGTLVRASRAFGISTVVALDGSVDPWNPKAVRASAGACFRVPVVRAPWSEVGPWLARLNVEVLAGDSGGQDVGGFDSESPWALAVGNEGSGLRPEVSESAAHRISVPTMPDVDSLNVGVAGSILLYVLTTRRG